MAKSKAEERLNDAHNRALAGSKLIPNRSDCFAYARIYSRIINGVYEARDSIGSNFTPSL